MAESQQQGAGRDRPEPHYGESKEEEAHYAEGGDANPDSEKQKEGTRRAEQPSEPGDGPGEAGASQGI